MLTAGVAKRTTWSATFTGFVTPPARGLPRVLDVRVDASGEHLRNPGGRVTALLEDGEARDGAKRMANVIAGKAAG